MTLDLTSGMPKFTCDGDGCPHRYAGLDFNVAKSVVGLKEAGWTVKRRGETFVHHCGRCALLLELESAEAVEDAILAWLRTLFPAKTTDAEIRSQIKDTDREHVGVILRAAVQSRK